MNIVITERIKKFILRHQLEAVRDRLLASHAGEPGLLVMGSAFAVLCDAQGRSRCVPGLNIVTNAGDVWYAQRSAGETPTHNFAGASAGIRLGDDNTAPTKTDVDVTSFVTGSGHAIDATYPKSNDGDTDNTGAGTNVVSWRFSFTTAQGNGTGIIELAIVDDIASPTVALAHALFTGAFDKTSSDTLKVFVNHTLSGV